MNANDELLRFILNLTPEQASKIVKHLEWMKELSDNEMVFFQSFASRVFTNKKVEVA